MNRSHRVLVVDACDEVRSVLTAALRREGRAAIEVDRVDAAVEVAVEQVPDLIVLDVESDTSPDRAATARLGAQADRTCTPVLVIGSMRRDATSVPNGQFFSKPYHYGPLIREIDRLLDRAA